jgi:hypothetical protein
VAAVEANLTRIGRTVRKPGNDMTRAALAEHSASLRESGGATRTVKRRYESYRRSGPHSGTSHTVESGGTSRAVDSISGVEGGGAGGPVQGAAVGPPGSSGGPATSGDPAGQVTGLSSCGTLLTAGLASGVVERADAGPWLTPAGQQLVKLRRSLQRGRDATCFLRRRAARGSGDTRHRVLMPVAARNPRL